MGYGSLPQGVPCDCMFADSDIPENPRGMSSIKLQLSETIKVKPTMVTPSQFLRHRWEG